MHTDFGFIYALTNPAMPGHVKIGMTKRRPEERLAELSSATGVPVEFSLAYSRAFEKVALAEKVIHADLEARGLRVSDSREFFQLSVDDAIAAIDAASARLAESSARELDCARFAHKADLLLAGEAPNVAQLEQALSWLEYAAELGGVEYRFRAAVLAHELASRRSSESTRGKAYRDRAYALYEQAAAEGVPRAHAQRALLLLADGRIDEARLALLTYLSLMPAGGLPVSELEYLVQTLHDDWMPHPQAPSLTEHLRPYRTALAAAARAQYPDSDPLHDWLLKQTHSWFERQLERAKVPLLALVGLGLLYVADPALFGILVTVSLLGWLLWWRRSRRRRNAARRKR